MNTGTNKTNRMNHYHAKATASLHVANLQAKPVTLLLLVGLKLE